MKGAILAKLGRNVLLFQEAEHLLKWLGARQKISGAPGELEDAARESHRVVGGETLGGVVGRAIAGSAPIDEAEVERAVAEHGAHLHLSSDVGGSDEFLAERREKLESLLAARNELIHQFFPKFDLQTEEGGREAGRYLDEQYDRHLVVVEELRRECEGVRRLFSLHAAALSQPEIERELLYGGVRQVTLVGLLQNIADEKAREDGWTSLNVAGQELASRKPKVMEILKGKLAYGGLKEAIMATGMFEFREEPRAGGICLLFRLQAEGEAPGRCSGSELG